MGKRQLQITCCFGKEDAGELLFRSFLLFLRRELEQSSPGGHAAVRISAKSENSKNKNRSIKGVVNCEAA